MDEVVKTYTNGEITIVWKPDLCIHSRKCFTGLPRVFNPNKRPWVNISGADSEKLMQQIDNCPSKALSYIIESKTINTDEGQESTKQTKVEALSNGPLMVYGNLTVKDAQGTEIQKEKATAFCRCGHSVNKPFCDGSHVKSGFKD